MSVGYDPRDAGGHGRFEREVELDAIDAALRAAAAGEGTATLIQGHPGSEDALSQAAVEHAGTLRMPVLRAAGADPRARPRLGRRAKPARQRPLQP